MKRVLLFLLVSSLFWSATIAQEFQWWPDGTYDGTVPTPASVLGYEIGDYLTDHHQMVDYIHRLEETSDRVRVVRFGQSVERRDMYLVIAATPENLDRVEEIRSRLGRLADPRTLSSQEAERIIREVPPVAWLNFANDGGETAAFEAGLLMAYQLAAGSDATTRKILDNSVVVLNMAANPDSHQAFVSWMKTATIGRAGTADPFAREHHVPWFISSDGNHYLIDSNRDAFALTQVETRAIARMLHQWNPQLWIDNHGEPNEYHFAPFVHPMNQNYPPSLREWAVEVGRNCARAFDRMGWTYTKEEVYDLFYPGYWDSYPAFHGAVAATYETNGGGWKNLSWEKPDGTLATLRRGVHSHFIANMATLETVAGNREGFLRHFWDFYRTGMLEADSEQVRAFVFPPGGDRTITGDLVRLLMSHQIEVYRLSASFAAARAFSYFDPEPRPVELPAGSYVIPMKQPRKRLLKALVEATPVLEESFVQELRAVVERNSSVGPDASRERLGFYDVTAWSLPLAFGVDTVLSMDPVPLGPADRLQQAPAATGSVESGPARYGYLFTVESSAGLALAGRLLQEGFRVAFSPYGFKNAGREFPPGTFLARVERNPERLHERMAELAAELGARVFASHRSWSETGPSMGSRRIIDLREPRILVFADEPTRAVTFGAVYSLLEQRFGLKFTAAEADYFERIDLGRYNVMILPDGSASGYLRLLGESGVERMRGWIRSGGVLIAIKGGAEFTTLEDVRLTDVEVVSDVVPAEGDDQARAEPLKNHPGSIFRTRVNNGYLLGIGCPDEMAVQFRGDRMITATRRGANVVRFPGGSHLGGHVWDETEAFLEGKAYMVHVMVGRGQVILFGDDPTFRAYWRGLDRLVMNSILLGPAIGAPRR